MRRSILLVSMLFVTACGDDEQPAPTGSAPLRVATYNAGLALGFVDYAAERAPLTLAAMGELPVDVICVQEVWQGEHVETLQESAPALPNGLFRDPEPSMPDEAGTACTGDEVTPLQTCVQAACADVGPGELANCALASCNAEYSATSSGCQTCIAANIGGSIDDIVDACALGNGGAYAYGGAFGTGILTSATVLEEESLLLDSTLNRRAILYTKISKPGFGEAHVFCTHLSPVFSDIPYPGEAGSWAAEQADQIEALHAFVQAKTGGEGRIVILGDFNTGPQVGTLEGEVPENYAKLEVGYENPYTSQADPACTWCGTNPLVDGGASTIIDHVLIKGFAGARDAGRILDATVSVPVDGAPLETAYSDHYGLAVTLE